MSGVYEVLFARLRLARASLRVLSAFARKELSVRAQVQSYSALRNSVFALVLCIQVWSVCTGPACAGANYVRRCWVFVWV
ncbi:MAG: hypothetical protein LBP35_00750 [Candidatus Ancillula trichonymphae]|nr:hypothetical protein [Candidatus Ancillula trichonymphae]